MGVIRNSEKVKVWCPEYQVMSVIEISREELYTFCDWLVE